MVYEVMGFGCEGTMEGDDIAVLEQFIQRYICNIAVRNGEFIVGEDLHSEAFADIHKDSSDFTGTDDADCFSVEVKSLQTAQGKIEFTGTVIGFMDAANRGQQQCHCVFGDRIGGICRNMKDMDFPVAGFQVYIIISRTPQQNDFHTELMEFFDDCRIRGIIHEDTYRVTAVCKACRILRQFCFIEFDRKVLLCGSGGLEGFDIIWFCVRVYEEILENL